MLGTITRGVDPWDVMLAGRILQAKELEQLNAEQLVILRAKIRAEILANDGIQKHLREIAEDSLRQLRGAKAKA